MANNSLSEVRLDMDVPLEALPPPVVAMHALPVPTLSHPLPHSALSQNPPAAPPPLLPQAPGGLGSDGASDHHHLHHHHHHHHHPHPHPHHHHHVHHHGGVGEDDGGGAAGSADGVVHMGGGEGMGMGVGVVGEGVGVGVGDGLGVGVGTVGNGEHGAGAPGGGSGGRAQRHTRQEDWVTCLDCIKKPKPPLPDRWRVHKDDCIKCVKARSRAVSADKVQIDNYVNHAYSRTGQLMVLMTFDPLKKELKLQGAPILVERFLNHDVQGYLRRTIFEPAVQDTEEARHQRACAFKKALPLLPRKGLQRMTQDELRSFIGPLVCAYTDREQPGWSDESKRIDCWPDGVPWGNPKHGSWKLGNETPNAIFRRIIANIYESAGREDLLKPSPLACRGACEKCCGVAQYDEDGLAMDGGVGVDPMQQHHHHHHPDMEEVGHMGPHQIAESDQAAALAAAAAVAAAAGATPLPTVPVNMGVGVLPGHVEEDHVGKRRRLEGEGEHTHWSQAFSGHLS